MSEQPPPSRRVDVRDPRTGKLVCRVDVLTGEVWTVGRGGDIRHGTLPPLRLPPCEARQEALRLDNAERIG